jgi:hypothetical protein
MASKGVTESVFETLIADGGQSWDFPARPGIRGRDVVLVAAAWTVLAGCIFFPTLHMAALGAAALVVSVIETGRQDS